MQIKKISIIFTLVILVAGGMFFSPLKAHAQFGGVVIDPAHIAETVANGLASLGRWIAEDALKALRDQIVKRLVDSMTDDIIQSIQGGGEPLFVQDFGAFLKRSSDIAFDQTNRYLETQGLDLCAPFAPQLQISFAAKFSRPMSLPIECSFDEFKENLKHTEDFISRGGWFSFQEMFNPQNNYFGMSILLENQYFTIAAQEAEVRKQETQASQGFLSVKQCTKWKVDENGEEWSDEKVDSYCEKQSDPSSCRDIQTKLYCEQYETVTPGQVVAQSAAKGVLKDFEYASNVESIISALTNTLLNKVFDAGRGLLDRGGSTYSGSTSYDVSEESADFVQRQQDRKRNTVLTTQKNYANAAAYLKGLRSSATEGRKALLDKSLPYCAGLWISNPGSKVKGGELGGPNRWGWAAYENRNGQRSTAVLDDLGGYPLPAGYSPAIDRINEENKKADPNRPAEKGYFDSLIEETNRAVPVADAKSLELQQILNDTSSSSLLLSATNTEFLSNIVSDYNNFIQEFSSLTSDLLLTSQMGAREPGSSGSFKTLGDVLVNVNRALNTLDLTGDGDHEGGGNFYYCHNLR